ncbi:MAG: hypothetical protein KUG77_28875 [Nannocystaceae bacterium]|nr:hypothetical protein [Nannocystaceae bacterium]
MPKQASVVRSVALVLGAAMLLGVSVSAGCTPKPTRVPALCSFAGLSAEESEGQALAPITWLTLTSPSVDRQAMRRAGPLMNACGQVIPPAFSEGFDCPGFEPAGELISTDLVEETDLIMDSAGQDRTVLWAATDELTSGEVEGAAALALWTEESVEVHAVGMLRGYRHGARVRLHSIGATPVLVLQSDLCDAQGSCIGVSQVVPIINKRLAELPVWESERGCIGRAQFILEKRETRELGDGTTRKFVLTRSLELADDGVFVSDLVRMDDFRTSEPDAEPTPYRKVSARRPLLIEGSRFLLEDEDLWERVLRDHGQVAGKSIDG